LFGEQSEESGSILKNKGTLADGNPHGFVKSLHILIILHLHAVRCRSDLKLHPSNTASFIKPFHTKYAPAFTICHLASDSFLNAPLGFAQSDKRLPHLRHYDTKLINVRGKKYRNVTLEDKFLDKEELSKHKIFVGYLDFHVNSKQTAKPGLSMSDCGRQMGSG